MTMLIQDLVEKYASILNGHDVNNLFTHLKELTSRSEAARLCDLERRTTYYWEDDREVRLSTKQKVLEAILEKDFLYTTKYLCERSFDISGRTIRLYLGTLYEKAMNPEIEATQFENLTDEFRKTIIEYSPMINSTMPYDVSQMLDLLKQRSTELDLDFADLPMSTMTIEDFTKILPHLIKIVPTAMDDDSLRDFSQEVHFSQDLVNFASNLRAMSISISARPSVFVPRTAFNRYQGVMDIRGSDGNVNLPDYREEGSLENTREQQITQIGSSAPPTMGYVT